MKTATLFVVLACYSGLSNAAFLTSLVSPTLHVINPLAQGVGRGIIGAGKRVGNAIDDVGVAMQDVTDGIATVAEDTLKGMAKTMEDVPNATEQTAEQLEKGHGLVAKGINAVFAVQMPSKKNNHHMSTSSYTSSSTFNVVIR